MNLVGLYFFSFLICGHLLQMSIKIAATVIGATVVRGTEPIDSCPRVIPLA